MAIEQEKNKEIGKSFMNFYINGDVVKNFVVDYPKL